MPDPVRGALAPVHAIFNNEQVRRLLLRLRLPLFAVGAGLLLTLLRPNAELFWPAFAVSMVGAALQSWCFAALHKKRELACKGPYALVRNPMYLARYVLILGALLLAANPWLLAAYTVLYFFYMVNRVKREEAALAPIFGEAYAEYCAEVRRFLPRLTPFRHNPVFFFRWNLFFKNNAHVNLLAALAFYAAAWWFLVRGA